jgi:CTP:molybdopterin cytidylyltransferase MocA
MAAASVADPELVGRPGHARPRIAHFHFSAATLTADVDIDVGHARRFYNIASVIPAIVLAAGRSSRMGRAKAMLPIDDHNTFLSRIIRTFLAAGVQDVVVVLGHDANTIAAAIADTALPVRIVVNPDYDRGQLSSLIAGLGVVDRPGVAATLVTLVDVPLVAPDTVRAVLERYQQTHAPIVRPTSGARHGHPLLVDRSLFPALRNADDIDTEEDYRRIVTGRPRADEGL